MSELRFEMLFDSSKSVQIRKGDLTVEKVDAIVNAANSYLVHGGGLAGAIVSAGGFSIQEESDALAPVPTGGAVLTNAGNLPCRFVIHAVGPIWSEHEPEKADELLAEAVRSSLLIAKDKNFRSISVPAISSGIFGFPKPRCAAIMLNVVEEFFEQNPETSLKEIRLCNFDEPTVSIFESEARSRFGVFE